jgi:hypothetical protein
MLQINADGTALQTSAEGVVTQTLADRRTFVVPADAIEFTDHYSDSRAYDDSIPTPRQGVREAPEIDQLVEDMWRRTAVGEMQEQHDRQQRRSKTRGKKRKSKGGKGRKLVAEEEQAGK